MRFPFSTALGLAAAFFLAIDGAASKAAPTSAAVERAADALRPHRGYYDMRTGETRKSSDVISITGGLAFEWAETCDGWTVQQRAEMSFLYRTETRLDIGWTFVTWEAKDGLRYRFTMKKTRAGEVYEEIRGEATIDEPGGAGRVIFSKPDEKEIPLPTGTMFPTAHTLELIAAAELEEISLFRSVFDGSGVDGALDINAVIGKAVKEPRGKVDHPIVGELTWPMQLAFFPTEEWKSEPEHEQMLALQDNGVVRFFTLDYGDFTVDAELKKVDALPAPSC